MVQQNEGATGQMEINGNCDNNENKTTSLVTLRNTTTTTKHETLDTTTKAYTTDVGEYRGRGNVLACYSAINQI